MTCWVGWWQRLHESFWFVPALFCVLGAVAGEVLVIIDEKFGGFSLGPLDAVMYRVGASGSRGLLEAIAGSVLATAATSFSITIAVISLASSTYGPRLVRNFMADRGNQVVLGVYLATFLYSLMVLRTIRQGPGEGVFVPHTAVSVAVLLALLSVGVLVYFIDHISDSVQVWTLAQRLRNDLLTTLEQPYPAAGTGAEAGAATLPKGAGVAVRAGRDGYVAGIEEGALLDLAVARSAVLALHVRPGSYCVKDGVMATAWPSSADDDAAAALVADVRSHVVLKDERTPHQDVEFAVQQLIELAVRALSPSTNDPYTALNAFDQLSAGLARIVSRSQPSAGRLGPDGALRLQAPTVGPAELISMFYEAVRTYALDHPVVLRRAMEIASLIGSLTADRELLRHLAGQLQLVQDAYEHTDPIEHDAQRLREELGLVREDLLAASG